MTFQINLFLLLLGSIQGLLIGLWMVREHRHKLSNLYFILFLLVIGLQLTFKFITKGWLMQNVSYFYWLSYKLPFLVGPLLYLFLKARKHPAFATRDLLHFLPFVLAMLTYMLPLGGLGQLRAIVHPYAFAILQIASLLIYARMSVAYATATHRKFVYIVTVIETLIAVTLAVMVIYHRQFPDVRLFFVSLTILVYWISYKIISDRKFFIEGDERPDPQWFFSTKTKYANSGLKADESERIEAAIRQILISQKKFTDPTLTIDQLASMIGTSRHHLSQVLNEKMRKTYSEFVNDLRMEEAAKRLCDPAHQRFTIAAIALDSGFSSVSNFNEVFRKKFGTTPSRYKGQQRRLSA